MVTEGLTVTEITQLLNKLRAITDFYHESENVKNIWLNENAEWSGFPELSVFSECPARWKSFLVSGRRFLELKHEMAITLFDKNFDMALLPSEWELLENICEKLQVF